MPNTNILYTLDLLWMNISAIDLPDDMTLFLIQNISTHGCCRK